MPVSLKNVPTSAAAGGFNINWEDKTPAPPPPERRPQEPEKPPVRYAPEPPFETRRIAIKAAKNPLLESAQPLLRAIADMPPNLDPDAIPIFHTLLEREVT